jgi:YegS/Rv2252/BmrU family lipid kinase
MYWFVVNRKAGNGRARKAWERLEPVLQRGGIAYRELSANDGKQASAAVRAGLKEGVPKALIVVGGDGTVHAILEAAADGGIPVGIIPAGSGNDLARSLGIPADPVAAWETVRRGRAGWMDLLSADGKLCVNIASAGLDAEVADQTERSTLKKWLNRFGIGQAVYVWSLIKVLFTYRPESVIMTMDGRPARLDRVWLIAMANLPYYGGGMRICPDARANDGMMDICVVSGVSRVGLLRAFPKVYRGAHRDHPAAAFFRAEHVRIEPAAPESALKLHGDGEPIGRTPFEAAVHRRKLLIIATERSSSSCIY